MIATSLERCPRFWKNALKLSRLFKTKLGWISFQEIRLLWTLGDLNPGPAGYEPAALTNWAKGPKRLIFRRKINRTTALKKCERVNALFQVVRRRSKASLVLQRFFRCKSTFVKIKVSSPKWKKLPYHPRVNDSDGNWTRVTAVKGRCLNRLTTEPNNWITQRLCSSDWIIIPYTIECFNS